MARDRGDAAVNGLADLPDDNEVIDRALPQWPEPRLPWRREGFQRGPKFAWNLEPMFGVTGGVIRRDLMSHVFARGFTGHGKKRATGFMIYGD